MGLVRTDHDPWPGDDGCVDVVGHGAAMERERPSDPPRPGRRGGRVVHLLHLRRRAAAFFNADGFVHHTVVAVVMVHP
jgi:hypothetical protein